MKALAVFHGHGSHWASRWLKEGFRHVFVCLQSDEWIRIDAQEGVPVIEIVAERDYDLLTYYETYPIGPMTVVEVEVGARPSRWPLTFSNCVGLAKVILGVRCSAFTPYQLYRHLQLKSVYQSLERTALSLPGKAVFAPEKPKVGKAPPPAPKETSPEVQEAGSRARVAELERKGRRAAIFTSGQGIEEELGIVSRPRARTAQIFGVPGNA